jgi:hypothetical protein
MEGCDEVVLHSCRNGSLEKKLIAHLVKKYPETTEVMKKYFGEDCLKRTGFKIKTLEIACILFDVDPSHLIQDIEKIRHWQA